MINRRSYSMEEFEEHLTRWRTWGKWGAGDELGAANNVTPGTILRAKETIKRGAVFSLALPLDRSGPQANSPTRTNPQRMMLSSPADPFPGFPRQSIADDAVYLPTQAATQWDALCHFFFDGKTYNGHGVDSVTARHGAVHNSIANFKDRAVGRGVLLDIARWKGRQWLEPGESIQGEDLDNCARDLGVEVGEGDFVLVRTGQLAQIRQGGEWGDYAGGPAPGLGLSTADFLCPRGVTAVATDTWGVEALPYEVDGVLGPLHIVLLVNAGIYLGEMWDLEALSEDCANDGVYEFFLTSQPLTVTGSVGSPINPLAIK